MTFALLVIVATVSWELGRKYERRHPSTPA
jgi:hypothetical protein